MSFPLFLLYIASYILSAKILYISYNDFYINFEDMAWDIAFLMVSRSFKTLDN